MEKIYGFKDNGSKVETLSKTVIKNPIQNCIFLGDSYTEGYSPDGNIPTGKRFWELFCQMEGITNYQGFYKGGIGFYQKVDGINYLQLLKNKESSIDKESIDAIFIFGGYNDSYTDPSKADVEASIKEFVEYAYLNYPNAKVIIGQIGYDTRLGTDGSNRRQWLFTKITPAYENVSIVKPSYIYLSNLELVLHQTDYMASDGIHPNELGHERLAMAIYNAYHGGFTTPYSTYEYVTIVPNSQFTTKTFNGQFFIANSLKYKTIRINSLSVEYAEGSYPSISSGGYKIGDVSNSKLITPTYSSAYYVPITIKNSSDKYFSCLGLLTVGSDKSINLSIREISNDQSGWMTIDAVKSLSVPSLDICASNYVL